MLGTFFLHLDGPGMAELNSGNSWCAASLHLLFVSLRQWVTHPMLSRSRLKVIKYKFAPRYYYDGQQSPIPNHLKMVSVQKGLLLLVISPYADLEPAISSNSLTPFKIKSFAVVIIQHVMYMNMFKDRWYVIFFLKMEHQSSQTTSVYSVHLVQWSINTIIFKSCTVFPQTIPQRPPGVVPCKVLVTDAGHILSTPASASAGFTQISI